MKVELARALKRSSPRPVGIGELPLEGVGLYDDLGEVGVDDDDELLVEVPGVGLDAAQLDLCGASYNNSETWS